MTSQESAEVTIVLVLISLQSKTNRAKKIPAMTKAKWISLEPGTSQQV